MKAEKMFEVASLLNEKQDLILNHRINAFRIARSLLRRWNAFFDLAEIQSLADITLCEAARNFDSSRGTLFSTYLFIYIKGALIREIRAQQIRKKGQPDADACYREFEGEVVAPRAQAPMEAVVDESYSPESLTYQRELRACCRRALATLKPLERQTVVDVSFMDRSITSVAKKRAFSRPYLSAVHSRAIKKLHPLLEALAA